MAKAANGKQAYHSANDVLEQCIPIPEAGCMLWDGHVNTTGRAQIGVNGKLVLAHRFVFEQVFGQIPNGMSVLHKCDVGRCMNPAHLYLGTQADNMRDLSQRNKTIRKLSREDHKEILDLIWQGIQQDKIARQFNVSKQTITNVKYGKHSWPE